ncbi:MAG: SAM-dependent methyltransferase [Dysgonamonadaceae bacterium]|jgi:16S rRNA G966 N2-methylase RsmD|nr:SAM-dependent methyltransferase [Dysgonamonadaceae bacterium]
MTNDETRRFIAEHDGEDIRQLALHAGNFANKNINIPFALNQIAGRKTAATKAPSLLQYTELIYPSRLAVEQCSSETTAQYKASLLSGKTFADLTGGFGIDFIFISQKFRHATYVEQQKELCRIVSHNFKIIGLGNIHIENTDSLTYLKSLIQPLDAIFIDPARRTTSGRRTSTISESEPNLIEIQKILLEKAPVVLVKLSPMLDIHQTLKDINHVAEIHITGAESECKELLLLLKQGFTGEPVIYPVITDTMPLPCKHAFTRSSEKNLSINHTSTLLKYLYEPHAVFLKAGCYKSIAQWFDIQKIHPDSHLYTSDRLVENFPGRTFAIEDTSSWNKKELKAFLRNISRANLTVRNFPDTTDNILKRLKIRQGGNTNIFATTLADGKHVLLKVREAEKQVGG